MKTTVISAYYIIPSKHPHTSYAKWIENFMSIARPAVVFVNAHSYELLAAHYSPSTTLRYEIVEISEFEVSRMAWEADLEMDFEINAGHSIDLYKVWNEKAFFVERVIRENPYHSEHFCWVDIGCFRDASRLQEFAAFPDARAFKPGQVTMLQVEPFQYTELMKRDVIDDRFLTVDRIGGTIFGGDAGALLQFIELFRATLLEFKSRSVFAGKDQSTYAWMVIRNPRLFHIVRSVSVKGYDRWFMLHFVLS